MTISKEKIEYRKANNLCPRDGRPNQVGRKLCEYCLKKSAEKTARHRNKKKNSGLCLSCGINADGHKFCDKCRKNVAISSHNSHVKRYNDRADKRQCTTCGGQTADGKKVCQSCADQRSLIQKTARDTNMNNNLCTQCGGDLGSLTGKRCQTCIDKRNEWYQGSTTQDKDKNRRDGHRIATIEHYGGKCSECGESRPLRLAIDHMNNDGNTHRKEINKYGSGFFKWLVDNDFPEGFQVLCHNCNIEKYLKGTGTTMDKSGV